jgi:hypothetical protein
MISIESNIAGVLERARRRPRDIREAMQRTLQPEEWLEQAREEARRTLWALAAEPRPGMRDERGLVDSFLDTVMASGIPAGFILRMRNPIPPVLGVEDFAMARDLQGGGDLRRQGYGGQANLFSELANQFDQMMTDWVADEKEKDKRDEGKTDEEIGEWISYLMLTPDSKLSAEPSGPGRVSEQEAKRRLLPHIVKYIESRQQDGRLSNETINAWLLAVLACWGALVRREFVGKLRGHMAMVRQELG